MPENAPVCIWRILGPMRCTRGNSHAGATLSFPELKGRIPIRPICILNWSLRPGN